MSGWEVPHDAEEPKQATGCGGGVRTGVGSEETGGVTQPLFCWTCCHQKQIPQAGLSPCGGGIISSMKWQRREAMCSSRAAYARVSRAEQAPAASVPRRKASGGRV